MAKLFSAHDVDVRTLVQGGLAFIATLSLAHIGRNWLKLSSIPTAGGTDIPLLSYLGTYRLLTKGQELLQEGYERFKGKAFKIAFPDRWIVILSGDALVDELRRLPHEVMSFGEAVKLVLEMKYTFGPEIAADEWHTELVRDHFSKRLDSVFPAVYEEIAAALDEYSGDAKDWVTLPAQDTVRKVICRASNRVFVGLPKCRNPDLIELNVDFTMDVAMGGLVMNLFPQWLKPLAGQCLTRVSAKLARAVRHLEPIVEERRQLLVEHGSDYHDKPNDLLSWALETERGSRASARELIHRILVLNFASVHNTSNACTFTLYALAAYPEHLVSLREEAEKAVDQYGWTKSAMSELVKLDSFIKECSRYWTFQGLGIMRLAMKEHTFCDGTTVPAGTMIATPMIQIHKDLEYYDRADEFLPFRFVDEPASRRSYTSTYNEHLTFGHGKQACPGRFFAVNELKLFFAHLVLNYDIRPEVEGAIPEPQKFVFTVVPSPTAKVQLRKRAA